MWVDIRGEYFIKHWINVNINLRNNVFKKQIRFILPAIIHAFEIYNNNIYFWCHSLFYVFTNRKLYKQRPFTLISMAIVLNLLKFYVRVLLLRVPTQ